MDSATYDYEVDLTTSYVKWIQPLLIMRWIWTHRFLLGIPSPKIYFYALRTIYSSSTDREFQLWSILVAVGPLLWLIFGHCFGMGFNPVY